jgi:hypothetical protein
MIYFVFANAGIVVTDIVRAKIDMGATSGTVEIGLLTCPHLL